MLFWLYSLGWFAATLVAFLAGRRSIRTLAPGPCSTCGRTLEVESVCPYCRIIMDRGDYQALLRRAHGRR